MSSFSIHFFSPPVGDPENRRIFAAFQRISFKRSRYREDPLSVLFFLSFKFPLSPSLSLSLSSEDERRSKSKISPRDGQVVGRVARSIDRLIFDFIWGKMSRQSR